MQHLGEHLKNHETVNCIFKSCSYKTNVYGSFRTHRSRNQKSSSVSNLKPEIAARVQPIHHSSDDSNADDSHEDVSEDELLPTTHTVLKTCPML